MNGEKKQIYYLSYVRVIACVAIIWLHTFTMEAMFYKNNMNIFNDIVSNTIPYAMMWAVPCFVMVTGALLLDPAKEITLKKIYSKYILRILLILLIFISAFTICDVIANKEKIGIISVIKRIGYKIYTASSWSHLWYLYLLIGIYILLPAFRALVRSMDMVELKYLIVIYFIFNSIIPMINKFSNTQIGFYITTNSIFPLYLILGYLIHSDKIKIGIKVYVIMMLVGELSIIGLSVYGIKEGNQTLTSLLGNYSFAPVVITSMGIFGVFKNIKIKNTSSFILFTDKLSFGIYLIHLAFLRYGIKYIDFNPYKHGGILTIIFIVLLVFILSFLLTLVLKMIPGLKKIL